MRFHVFALPDTQTTREYLTCAYTQKNIKFCQMMKDQGHHVTLYAGDENEAPCDELVVVTPRDEQPTWDMQSLPQYPNEASFRRANGRIIGELAYRIEEHDFLCITSGCDQALLAAAYPHHMAIEVGVGYEGVFAQHKAFESYAWMHHVYGLQGQRFGNAYDAVIPNAVDPANFDLVTKKDDYLLYCGRIIHKKGVVTAIEIAKRTGMRLVLAGPVDPEWRDLRDEEGDLEFVGAVGVEQRNKLMGSARALLVPTNYIEPWGGVSIEAMLCGTPVIATDWGAFTETVIEGISGARFRTPAEGAQAVERASTIDPALLRAHAIHNYSLGRVGELYHAWFEALEGLWDGANDWYGTHCSTTSRYERY